MNPNDEIDIERIGGIVTVTISAALQRVHARAGRDPRMLQLERLMDEAEDAATADMILSEMGKRLEELARVERHAMNAQEGPKFALRATQGGTAGQPYRRGVIVCCTLLLQEQRS